jgi:hypothetical protein
MRRALVLLAAAAAFAPLTGADAAVRAPDATGPLGTERLSDERTITRWAHPAGTAKVRSRPDGAARTITRLRLRTEDGPPEVYLVLRSRRVGSAVWLKVRLPMRPNGRKGWVRREALGPLNVVRTHLRVNRRTLRATLYKAGKAVWSSPIGVGTPSTPTPAGRFWIRERMKAMGGVYGPWAFGTERVLRAQRLARRRRGRHPRHERAAAHPGPPVPRLRPRPEPGDLPAGQDHARRHAGPDPLSRR